MLLRIPGFGTRAVERILETRRFKRLRIEDVGRLCQSIAKVRPFIVADGWSPGAATDATRLRETIAPKPRQLELFR